MYAVFDNGSTKGESFYKGCAIYRACEQLEKGNITEVCPVAHMPSAECKAKCCYGEECNKGNILDTAGYDSSKSSGKTLVTSGSVLGLFFGLLLAVVSINY